MARSMILWTRTALLYYLLCWSLSTVPSHARTTTGSHNEAMIQSKYRILSTAEAETARNNQRQMVLDASLLDDEENISFDGYNLDAIQELALLKAQQQGQVQQSDEAAVSNFCNMSDTPTIHGFSLGFGYTVEYLSMANVTDIISHLEVVLRDRLSSVILTCQNTNNNPDTAAAVQTAQIMGHTADPADLPLLEGVCVPDDLQHSCTGVSGRINLFLTSFFAEPAARNWTLLQIEQHVFDDKSFVIQVGRGLVQVKMGLSEVITTTDVSPKGDIAAGESDGRSFSSSSTLTVLSAVGGLSIIFGVMIFVWHRARNNKRGVEPEVSTIAPEPPGSSTKSGGEEFSSSGEESDDESYSPRAVDSGILPSFSAASLSIVYECDSHLEQDTMEMGGAPHDIVQAASGESALTIDTHFSEMPVVDENEDLSPFSNDYTGSPPSFETSTMASDHNTPEMLGIIKREDVDRIEDHGLQRLISVYGAPASISNFHEDEEDMVLGIHKKIETDDQVFQESDQSMQDESYSSGRDSDGNYTDSAAESSILPSDSDLIHLLSGLGNSTDSDQSDELYIVV